MHARNSPFLCKRLLESAFYGETSEQIVERNVRLESCARFDLKSRVYRFALLEREIPGENMVLKRKKEVNVPINQQ